MNCGHPKAARQIVVEHGKIVTRCWACTVEKELRDKP